MARDLNEYTFQHNGVDMEKVLHNGTVEIWSASQPWTWVSGGVATSGNTLMLTETNNVNISNSNWNGSAEFVIPQLYLDDSTEPGYCEGYTNTVNAKHNKTMKIVVSSIHGAYTRIVVNGETIVESVDTGENKAGTYTVDITPNTDIRLDFRVGSGIHAVAPGNLSVSEISFY